LKFKNQLQKPSEEQRLEGVTCAEHMNKLPEPTRAMLAFLNIVSQQPSGGSCIQLHTHAHFQFHSYYQLQQK
jgi:hypothetical protein